MDKNIPGQRLKAARLNSKITPHKLAEIAHMSAAEYFDLEDFDDLSDACSLQVIKELLTALGTTPEFIFAPAGYVGDGAQFTFLLLKRAVEAHLADGNLTLDEFEDSVGWELKAFLKDPETAWHWNLDCLRAVCAALRVNWLPLLRQNQHG
jgi:hypothetical protein